MSGKRKTAVLGAVGDVVLSGPNAEMMQANGAGWLMEKMLPELAKADVLFGNMESMVLPPGFPAEKRDPKGMVSPFDGTAALKEAGFGFMNLANNHVLDGGTLGMFHTQKLIEAHGIVTGGVGETQAEARQLKVIEAGGLRIGFLCYCEDCNWVLSTRGPGFAYYDEQTILEDIAANRGNVDVLVVSVHADIEFMETPCPQRRDIARRLARAGATVILEHHPHVPQGVEMIGKSLIAYSLGNFAFNAHSDRYLALHKPHTTWTCLLRVTLSPEGVESFERVPVKIDAPPNERPVPLAGAEADKMLAYFDELDRKVRDDAVVAANWRAAAMKLFNTTLRQLRELEEPEAVQHLFAKSLFVAENASWSREVYEALRETWQQHRDRVDPYHRPSYAFVERLRPKKK
ncbi:MAG TPA: CapA family protein [Phycisphaerae bacterium]|nr:CapA family protein [Phycisphaerae bacterium]HUT60176.1 CapA family protein [Phycisphaerae bacterium]